MARHLYLTSDTPTFDPSLLASFTNESFTSITYLPFSPSSPKPYLKTLTHLADDLEHGDLYAIIAFSSAASVCLDFYTSAQPKMAALICYYPTTLPSPGAKFDGGSGGTEVLVHIAGDQPFAPAVESYSYEGAKTGFAEWDLGEEVYDRVSARLAWTRTMRALRRGFRMDAQGEVEKVREGLMERVYGVKDVGGVMGMLGDDDPYVNCVPTMTGGIGHQELLVFYRDYFIPKNPPSLRIKLVSRTIGTDQVVDEMIISFKHTQEVPWLLPGVQATDKTVNIAVVSIIAVRGGRLVHEHLYWDQASVLVQVGLLDPKLVPEPFQKQGLQRLPVFGNETAAKVLEQESQPSNELVPGWTQSIRGQSSKVSAQRVPQRPKPVADGGKAWAS